MAQKNKKKHPKHHPKPTGMTYADKLARDRMVKEAVEKAAHSNTVKLQSDIRSQRALWLMIVGYAKAHGHGPKRVGVGLDGIADASDWFLEMTNKHGREYALDKLRQEAERISGIPMEYLYEREIVAARKRNEERGIFFSVIEEEEP